MGTQLSKKRSSPRFDQRAIMKSDLSQLAVITVLFNPMRYKSRYKLYDQFAKHMSRSGVTLLTIECIFDCEQESGLPKQRFRLARADQLRHLRIKAPSVLWLKENLINMAVQRLPISVDYIAWLDADVEFERLDWPHLTMIQLQRYPIVQLFQLSQFLGPAGKKQILRRDYSFVYSMQHGRLVDPYGSSDGSLYSGCAWAMRRETFNALGGLLDFSIFGAGDVHFAYALFNRIEETIPTGVHKDYRYLAQLWGERLAQLSGNGAFVGCVPVNLRHCWHEHSLLGSENRRWSLLERYQFSPFADLEKNNRTGLLRLTDHRRSKQVQSIERLVSFQKDIIDYFQSPKDDKARKRRSLNDRAVLPPEPTMDPFLQSDGLLFHDHRRRSSTKGVSQTQLSNVSFWRSPYEYPSNEVPNQLFNDIIIF